MAKVELCSVEGCNFEAVRSLNIHRVANTSLQLKGGSRKAFLCKLHYKQFKKETKKDRELEHYRFRG